MESARALLVAVAHQLMQDQSPAGALPAGHNGPYHDPETPTRNTAHGLYLLAWLSDQSWVGEVCGQCGDRSCHRSRDPFQSEGHADDHNGEDLCFGMRQAAHRAADYLLSEAVRPQVDGGQTRDEGREDERGHVGLNRRAGAFWCRMSPHKDDCNGLIGQAWVVEALLLASQKLGWPELRALALGVMEQHRFSESYHAWHGLTVSGETLPVVNTFNQQLWFAAMAAQFDESYELKGNGLNGNGLKGNGLNGNGLNGNGLKGNALRFLDRVATVMRLYPDGVIFHHSSVLRPVGLALKIWPPLSWGACWAWAGDRWRARPSRGHKAQERVRSLGYHAFNWVALGYLKAAFPDHGVWRSGPIKKAWAVIEGPVASSGYAASMAGNVYGPHYNPMGFEVAYAQAVFGARKDGGVDWVAAQLDHYRCGQDSEAQPRVAVRSMVTGGRGVFGSKDQALDGVGTERMDGGIDQATGVARVYEVIRWLEMVAR